MTDNDGLWVIIEVRLPWERGAAVQQVDMGQDRTGVRLIPVRDAVEAELNIQLETGVAETTSVEAAAIKFGRVDTSSSTDLTAIESILILYRDDRGRAIAAVGSVFGAEAEQASLDRIDANAEDATTSTGNATSPDGVIYSGTATRLVQTGNLTLVIQDSNIGKCFEIRAPDGEMFGGCGSDLSAPIAVGVGSIGDTGFVSGWVPVAATRLVLTFDSGETQEIRKLERVPEHESLAFFLELSMRAEGQESLPRGSVAYDQNGNIVAELNY